MIKQFTPRPRSCVPSFLHTLTPSPRSARRQGQAWVFAVLFGLGQAAHAAGGDPDLTFGGDGRVITDLSNAQRRDQVNDLAIQFDDKIVVVGLATRDGDANVAVVRYMPDGTPDNTFGQQGVAIVDVLADEDDSAEGIVLQRDGKIVVVGRAGNFVGPGGNPGSFLIARLNLDGTVDRAFGGGQGFVTTQFGPGSDDFATAVVLQPDGRIVAAGRSNAGGSADFALARYNTDGSLDDGGPQDSTPGDRFGANGLVLTDFVLKDRVLALALDADGRLVAAGCRTCDSDDSDFALARYLADGQLDPSFDGDGKVATDFPLGGRDIARGVAIQASDGKIVAGGGADDPAGSDVFALARYLPDGRLDTSFDGDGRVTTDFDLRNDLASAVIVQPDGKIVAAGNSNTDVVLEPAALAIAQYRPDGSLDNDFGSGGKVLTCLSPAGAAAPCDAALTTLTRARAVVLDRNGRLVVAGLFAPVSENPDAFDFLVARYNKAIVESDVRRCQGRIPTLFGSPEQTTLRGTPGRDVILGSDAGELIIGGGGNDIICGGGGDDLIFGQGGRDQIDGGPGNDTLDGGARNDILRGGPGNDMLVGGSGDDELRGNAGNDELIGDRDASDKPVGKDRLIGGRGEDRMFGGPGSDVMFGGPGNDRMVGGRGADRANGGSGENKCFQSESLVSCRQTKPRPGGPRPRPSIPPPCNFPGC